MSTSRQLAAILFADIQGYTALMQEDEVQANLLREKFLKILDWEISQHHGRILKLSGDGALCSFNSAIEATLAAISIQIQIVQEPKVPLRIGIHIGDVMFEESDVHGDGVNIASRIESFAVPGSVFISGKVYDEIKNQKNIEAISLGMFELKNVNTPIEIFAIRNEGLVVPPTKMLAGKGKNIRGKNVLFRKWFLGSIAIALFILVTFFLFKKYRHPQFAGVEKSIAVLPFTNMSDDQDNEYFSDGITEDIITRLSQVSDLKVISRTSVMRFKNTMKSIKEIASELDVAVILEGSVQKNGNKVRITAQLINTVSDEHMWAEKYDVDLKDIFQIQSDVSELIVLSLNATLTTFQKSRIEKRPTENLEAYNLYLRANYLWNKQTPESTTQAVELFTKATKLDSNFAEAYAATAMAAVSRGPGELSWEDLVEFIRMNSERAIAIDSNLASAHTALGEYKIFIAPDDDLSLAMKEFDKAIQLDPNYAHAWTYKGHIYELNYEFAKVMPFYSQALNLDPLSPIRMANKAKFLAMFGNSAQAMGLIRKAETIEPEMRFLTKMKQEIYFNAGEYDQWLQLMQGYDSARVINHIEYLMAKAVYYSLKGDQQKSKALRDTCTLLNAGYTDMFLLSACQYWMKGKDKAFKTLKTGFGIQSPEECSNLLRGAFSYYVLTPLLIDPEFEAIKKECGWKPLE